jgi:PKD domain-containing protein
MRKLLVYAAALSLPAIAACTVHQNDVPTVSGPSSLAISLSVTATPDTLPQDGASRSLIVVKAFNAGGQPYPGLAVRLDMQVNGVIQDFGTLSARTLVTGKDGTATSTYTAPAGPSTGGLGTSVTLVATPVASDASSAGVLNTVGGQFQAMLRLTPVGVVIAPGQAQSPTAIISSVTPSSPKVGQAVLFNGSTSCPAGVTSNVCNSSPLTITSYDWDFGDGTAHGSGSTATHIYNNPGPVAVQLVITNSQGNVSKPAVSVVTVVVGGANPVAAFTFSQNGNAVTFDGSTSTGTITSYFWNFGDGTTSGSANPIVTHTYAASGGKQVTLTVTDVNGNSASVSKPVVIP